MERVEVLYGLPTRRYGEAQASNVGRPTVLVNGLIGLDENAS